MRLWGLSLIYEMSSLSSVMDPWFNLAQFYNQRRCTIIDFIIFVLPVMAEVKEKWKVMQGYYKI